MLGDETEYLQPVLGLSPSQRFKPLKSTWVAVILVFVILTMEAAGTAMVFLWPNTHPHCGPLYMLLYCQAALWFLVLLLDHVLKWHHNKLRLDGYLTSYERVHKYGSLPFYVVSLGTAVMLVVIVAYQESHWVLEQACLTHGWSSPQIVLLNITFLESALLFYILVLYLVTVRRFNLTKAPPDIHRPDTWEDFTNHEVGFRERGEDVQELLRKQADTIRYYRDANAVLQEKVLTLTADLRANPIN